MPDEARGATDRGARLSVVLACAASSAGAAIAAWLVLSGRGEAAAGGVALAAGAALVASAATTGRPGRGRERVLVSVADRIYDGAILGAVIWIARVTDPWLAAAALAAFAFGTLAAYARARAGGLGYDLSFLAAVSVVRVAIVSLALSLGWGVTAYVALALWQLGSTVTRVAQVRKGELA